MTAGSEKKGHDVSSNAIPANLPPPSGRLPLLALQVLVGLCLVLPLLVYGLVGLYRYQQIRLETEVRLDRALRIAQEHALKIFDTNELVLDRVLDALGSSDARTIQKREKALHDQLRGISWNKPQIQSISVVGPEGKLLASDRSYPAPAALTAANQANFQWHRVNRDGLYISQLLTDNETDQNFFAMSRGRYAADGAFEGLVSISLALSYFETIHSDLVADEPGLAITMLREDGMIFSRWPLLADAQASLSPDSLVMSKISAGQTFGIANGVTLADGQERLLAFSKVGAYPVFLGTGMDVREIRSRWRQEMAWLGMFGLPALIGLLIAAYLAWQRTRDALQTAQQLHDEIETRQRVEEALLQAQKLEALGRLTGGVAHDFNNALMVISNHIFLLKRKHPSADGPQLASIGRAIESATKLTRQLLAFSRRQAMVPEYLRLQHKLPGLKDLLGPVLGSQITLSLEIAPDTQPITVDSAEFELALINLAINARDAMPSGGRFGIKASNAGLSLPPMLKQPMVVVEASDTGSGIEAEVLNKVFEPFFTTKPVGQGTGLGLSQIYGLCQRAGGLATIQSQMGAGTTVSLFFPASTDKQPDHPHAEAAVHRNLQKNILLVEDNQEVATALTPVLQTLGCTVTHINRGAAARDWLLEKFDPQSNANAGRPDILLTDVVMPGTLDGLALATYARDNFPQLKIILMTGYTEQLETISRLGFQVLPKPCSADILAEAISKAGNAGFAGFSDPNAGQ